MFKTKDGQSILDDTIGLAKELGAETRTDAKIYALSLIVRRMLVVLFIIFTLIGLAFLFLG